MKFGLKFGLMIAVAIVLAMPAQAKPLPRCVSRQEVIDAARIMAKKKMEWGKLTGEGSEDAIVKNAMAYDDYQIADQKHSRLRYRYIDQQAKLGSCQRPVKE